MKNSQETITLPTFPVTLVHAVNDELVSTNIHLDQWMAEKGQGLILYFYPKDNTQGCSVQASDFTAHAEAFSKQGYAIIGVSRDNIKSHQNFINKKELSIGLISDGDEQLCQHFDVIQEKMMYGKTHLGVVRSTFIFDKNGQMTASFRNVKAKDHATTLLEFLTH